MSILEMLKKLKGNDIVIAKVVPVVNNLIQQFCALRMPQYDQFTKEDWDNFIPSNRQVMFKRNVTITDNLYQLRTMGLVGNLRYST